MQDKMSMVQKIQEFIQYRELLYTWISREIRVRYKQSLLGALWAILQPLALMLLFVLVFSVFVRLPSDDVPYPLFSYTALLPWTYFATAVTFGTVSLINNMDLVTKIYFPREILPLASIGAAFIDFAIASGVMIVLILFYQIRPSISYLWLPLIVIIQTIFTAGIILPTAALIVFFRDVRFIVPLGLQAWMYATPIIYPLSAVPDKIQPLYILNPMAGIIDAYRRVILHGLSPAPFSFSVSILISLIMVAFGYFIFKRMEGSMPDVI